MSARAIITFSVVAIFCLTVTKPTLAIESLIPADQLGLIRLALPEVAYPELAEILASEQTLWYDDEVMTPSYQDSVGASSNDRWPNLVAGSQTVIRGMHDYARRRWQFPFGTTAGTDNSTNTKIVNFVFLPHVNGQVKTITITAVLRNADRPQWTWQYWPGTVFGEVIFIRDGADLLPSEIRTRKRYPSGWAMNVYRPFPRASQLADRIRELRPDWPAHENLSNLMRHLGDATTLRPASLRAQAALAPLFQQDGFLDELPDFADPALVRELLTNTPFASAYNTPWKVNGSQKTFAASTRSSLSIVPNNYTAGLLQVTDEACMRCHKETGRLVSEFYFDLYLYGELWGKDGIFSFHPYDERRYPELRYEGVDNRSLNPVLRRIGVFRTAF
jgi:hypothetical protein